MRCTFNEVCLNGGWIAMRCVLLLREKQLRSLINMNTSGCREGIEETPRGINGITTISWIGKIAGPKAQGRLHSWMWKNVRPKEKKEDFILLEWKLGAQRPKEGIWKIASPKVQGRHTWENYTLCTCSIVGKPSTQIQVKAPGKTILALACKKMRPKGPGKKPWKFFVVTKM